MITGAPAAFLHLRERVGRIVVFTVAMLAFPVVPERAEACAACLREADNRVEFIVTTGLLTFLPLIVLGLAFWWLRRRVASMERAGGAEKLPRDAAPAPELHSS